MFYIFYQLAFEGRKHAKALGSDAYRVYMRCGVLTLFIWMCYPIAFGVSEGGNVIAPDSEAVFYGILDFFPKPIFSIALLLGHWNINPERMGLRIRHYDEAPVFHEKRNPNTSLSTVVASSDGHSDSRGAKTRAAI